MQAIMFALLQIVQSLARYINVVEDRRKEALSSIIPFFEGLWQQLGCNLGLVRKNTASHPLVYYSGRTVDGMFLRSKIHLLATEVWILR